jgi:glycosyltransferase involved in cell wall biosynthesis
MRELSILIPTFNDPCSTLVRNLHQQAEALGMTYEILVADDGSTQQNVLEENRSINTLPHCQLIERRVNAGRAAIRNFLAQQAQYAWLLFVDSDMVVCREDFVKQYVTHEGNDIVYGGVVIGAAEEGNLRSLYEKAAEHEHTVEKRRQSPYQDFHTANFMIRKELMLQHLFDERFRYYGYEDVLLGKAMKQAGVAIDHIDNPLSFEVFEDNETFVAKTEEGLRTLHTFRDELKGYSRLLDRVDMLPMGLVRLWHRLFGSIERRKLLGPHPSLTVFNLYKIGYYSTLQGQSTRG